MDIDFVICHKFFSILLDGFLFKTDELNRLLFKLKLDVELYI